MVALQFNKCLWDCYHKAVMNNSLNAANLYVFLCIHRIRIFRQQRYNLHIHQRVRIACMGAYAKPGRDCNPVSPPQGILETTWLGLAVASWDLSSSVNNSFRRKLALLGCSEKKHVLSIVRRKLFIIIYYTYRPWRDMEFVYLKYIIEII